MTAGLTFQMLLVFFLFSISLWRMCQEYTMSKINPNNDISLLTIIALSLSVVSLVLGVGNLLNYLNGMK